jgi:hypothetical protein
LHGATLAHMRSKIVPFLVLMLAQMCSAQVCLPETQPQPDNAASYIRAEIKTLRWIRYALNESKKIQPPTTPNDPGRLHKMVVRRTVANLVSDDYDCAARYLQPYKASKNKYVRDSVESLLAGIDTTKQINGHLLQEMEAVDRATKAEDIDQIAIAKRLGDLTSSQKDVRKIVMVAVKLSTFGILRVEGGDDNSRPVAFTITAKQRDGLLTDAQKLAKEKEQPENYVDVCAQFLVSTLKKQLPTLAE